MDIEHGANLTAQNKDGVTSGVNAKNKNGLAPFGLPSQGRLAEVIQYAPLSTGSTVPILVATTTIEPGTKVMDLYLHFIY
jgi:hypothetical protein